MTSIEMAILFPTVLLLIMSMFQISLYWHTSNSVSVAAEQGLIAGQIHPEAPRLAISEAESEAQWILDQTNHGEGNPTASINGDLLTVTVVANAPRIIGIGTWQVRSVAQGRFEEFIPADQR